MATVTVREIDDEVRAGLRMRAARHGRTLEDEVREILRRAVAEPRSSRGLGTRIYERFAPHGGVDLPLPSRAEDEGDRPLPDLTEHLAATASDGDVDIDLTVDVAGTAGGGGDADLVASAGQLR